MQRPNFPPYQIIPNTLYGVSGSMASNITSPPTIIGQLTLISYSVLWTGSSPVGTVSVQVSDDYSVNNDGSVRNPGTWNFLPLSFSGSSTTTIPISGNTGNGMVDIAITGHYAIRLIYTATSGTGQMTAIINGKVS